MSRTEKTCGEHDPIARGLIETSLSGISLAAAGANVIMQPSVLPVGHGVAESRVNAYLWDTRRRIRLGRPIV